MDNKKQKDNKEEQPVILGNEETPESDSGQVTTPFTGARMTEEKGNKQEDLLQKLIDTEDKYKRALADYQNLQRRTIEEKREWARLSNKDLVLKLLPILDTLMLAEKHTKDQNFVLTVQQFLQVLRDEGFERIQAIGKPFDPLLMEVVETKDGEDWQVLDEVKAGFRSGEVIIRPAYVVVGRKV